MAKKIFITGATGFLGSNLIRKLYGPGNKITIFALDSKHPFLERLDIKRVEGDIRDYNSLLKAMKGCDYVYHLAALSISDPKRKKEIFSTNVDGTGNVMKACLKTNVKKAVHISSIAVLGFSTNKNIKLTENNNMDVKDYIYGQSKKLGEDSVYEYVARGLNATIVNPCSIFGAGELEPLPLIRSIIKNRIKFTYPGGTCFVAVDDVVNGLLLAMEKGKKGERYILSSKYMRFIDMYNKIAGLLKKRSIKIELPRISYGALYALGAFMEKTMENPPISKDVIRWSFNYRNCDSSKARRELGWAPKTSFEDAIRQALEYYKEHKMLEIE